MSTSGTTRTAERKVRDREARRAKILEVARRVAEGEGWPAVTVRRLSDEIAYSQPVLYGHFESRDAIVAAVAIEGFQELGGELERARRGERGADAVRAVAEAYLRFAAASPALYEAMFLLRLGVPFDEAGTPPELRFAFTQLVELFGGKSAGTEVLCELFWASLHGLAELLRTKRLPAHRQSGRVSLLVEMVCGRAGASLT